MTDIATPVEPLRVSSTSTPQSVAGAIAKSITIGHNYPEVRAIGHGAIGQAVKAIAIARGYVAPLGIDLACNIGFADVQNAEDKTVSALVFIMFRR